MTALFKPTLRGMHESCMSKYYSGLRRAVCQIKRTMSQLYPASEAHITHFLPVSDLHTLHVQVYGKEDGDPVVHVHGGPGGGTEPKDARRFDPSHYRIFLIDQRGSGKSTPPSCLEQNTTWDLVADIERVREWAKVDKWHVFGGSWGSTLSLAYAQTHPDRVKSLVLRGIFTVSLSCCQF